MSERTNLDLRKMRQAAAGEADEQLTPKSVLMRVNWVDAKTGEAKRMEGRSEVPIDKSALARATAAQCNGLPWQSFSTMDQGRFTATARIAMQFEVADDDAPAFASAVSTDDALCFQLGEALHEHERRWFLRGNSAGGDDAATARVAVPAFDAPAPSAKR
jgi:hypothetical protein